MIFTADDVFKLVESPLAMPAIPLATTVSKCGDCDKFDKLTGPELVQLGVRDGSTYGRCEAGHGVRKSCWSCAKPGDFIARSGLTVSPAAVSFLPLAPGSIPDVRGVSRLLVTVAVGESAKRELAITGPLFEAYAARVGARFLAITEPTGQPHGMMEKWVVHYLSKSVPLLCYIDADIVIKPDAPNVFEMPLGPHGWAAFDERPHLSKSNWIDTEAAEVAAHQGLPVPARHPSYNGGVLLLTPQSADLYAPPDKPFVYRHCYDQSLLSVRASGGGRPASPLDRRFNWCAVSRDFWDGLDRAWFVHLNGMGFGPHRLDLLRRFAAGDYTPGKPRLCLVSRPG
jgi:hypothetical protein